MSVFLCQMFYINLRIMFVHSFQLLFYLQNSEYPSKLKLYCLQRMQLHSFVLKMIFKMATIKHYMAPEISLVKALGIIKLQRWWLSEAWTPWKTKPNNEPKKWLKCPTYPTTLQKENVPTIYRITAICCSLYRSLSFTHLHTCANTHTHIHSGC